ncbi:UDP-glucosyltransferase 2-like [Periplaneta americana]|uniref:UDP-glucosyltransferase 2-like n=1 Tax=Periplaneta americana TaxID=6978 RepID=UPI0037E75E72
MLNTKSRGSIMEFHIATLAAILLILPALEGARILALMNMASSSHTYFSRTLSRALARRGHQVLEISPDVDPEPTPNRTSILMKGIYEAIAKRFARYEDFAVLNSLHHVNSFSLWCEIVCTEELQSEGAQELLGLSSSERFDAIITDTSLNECFYGFISKFGSPPVIGISSHGILPWTSTFMGTPENPSYMPHYLLPYSNHMNFIERLHNFMLVNYVNFIYEYYVIYNQETIARRYFKEELESYWNLERNFSLFLANIVFGLDYPRPLSPNVIPVGGMHIKKEYKPLPKDLKDILDEAKDGFILFSLGTNFQFERLQKEKISAFVDAFAALSQLIILKCAINDFEGITLPPNVVVCEWLPQNDVLAHPNIKAFLTHCGRLSVMEAIYRAVPIVAMPLAMDQHANMRLVLERGVAVHLDYKSLTKDTVLSAMREILSNHRGSIMDSRLAILVAILCILPALEGARILVLMNLPSPSHTFFSRTLSRALARRGHQVLEISTEVDNQPTPNWTSIHMEGIYEAIEEGFKVVYEDYASIPVHHQMHGLSEGCQILCRVELQSKGGQELLRLSSSERFDAIITDTSLNECFYGFISKFGSPPVIGISSHGILPWTSTFMGTPENPSYMPHYLLPYSDRMNFIERLHNFIIVNYVNFVYEYDIVAKQEAVAKEYFKEELQPYWNLERNFSLFLANTVFGLDYPRPISSNVIAVGGMHLTGISDYLPKDLKDILDEAKDGFIFFSLGTKLKFGRLQKDKTSAIFEAFAALPLRILLKCSTDDLAGIPIPPNVIVRDWFPQNGVLAHPNIRIFVTHCGRLSMMEGIHWKVPIVGIPLVLDHYANMRLLLNRGVGVQLDYNSLTKEGILSAMREILSNDIYRENMERLSAVFRDQADSALDRAVFWTEYVIRHKGAPHLRPASTELYWYQYLLLDVILFLLVLVILSILIIYYAFSALYRFAKRAMKHKKID